MSSTEDTFKDLDSAAVLCLLLAGLAYVDGPVDAPTFLIFAVVLLIFPRVVNVAADQVSGN